MTLMEFTIEQIAALLGGKIQGDGNIKINTISKIQDGVSGSVTFLSNPKYENYLYTTHASAVIVNQNFVPKQKVSAALILVEDPYSSFTILLEEYHRLVSYNKTGIESPNYQGNHIKLGKNIYLGAFSYIGDNVEIGNNVKVYPHVYIGDNAKIGDNTILYPGVKIYPGAVIGNHCTIQAGAVLGSDGFGFAPQTDGTYKTIPQLGNVILEDHVDVGANTVIDCATMGNTIIRKGVKLDNLIQVAHNVEIGKNTVIAAQSGISGSTIIGDNCVFAGQVGIVGHIKIANNTSIGAQSGIGKSILVENKKINGTPGNDLMHQLKCSVIYRKLPELLKRIEELEEKVITLPLIEHK